MMQSLFFSQTVDRFAQFLISPLLKEDSVDREIQAVESGKLNFHFDFFITSLKPRQVLQLQSL